MITIRKLNDTESAAAYDMAAQIFYEEQEIPMELMPIDPAADPFWWGVFDGETLVGTMASYVEDGVRHLGRMTISPTVRGRGVGSMLMEHCLADLFAEGSDCVLMDCRDATVHIVKKLGGRTTGEPRPFFKGNCTTMAITKEEFESRNR